MIDCLNCKRPTIDCPGAEWYSPRDIRFCRLQVVWIIKNLSLLKVGIWPQHTDGALGAPLVQHSKNYRAYFETPGQIAGEVDYRLQRTGIEGKLLVAELGIYRDVSYEELGEESKRALNYITGWRRKKLGYSAWKRQRKFRRKEVK